MQTWIIVLILMLISGATGLVVGYVLGADSPPMENKRREKNE